MPPRSLLALALVGASFAVNAVQAFTASDDADAMATLTSATGETVGTVMLRETPHGVFLEAKFTGLSGEGHGFHIHETGSCADGFKAAGGHFNPSGGGHGHLEGDRHAGDLPNLYGGVDGALRIDLVVDQVALADGATGLFDEDGSAFILHAKPDTYGETAGAGGRIACGIIERT